MKLVSMSIDVYFFPINKENIFNKCAKNEFNYSVIKTFIQYVGDAIKIDFFTGEIMIEKISRVEKISISI